ncbi:MAG: hypothetical protein KF914_13425 [Rhizobiaceae bacterium]|nr:hypothetical protein [Rhizobiaceae bacterium]
MQLFSMIARWRHGAEPPLRDDEEGARWVRDPLSHPDLASMSQRELGDLPMRRPALAGSDAC